MKSLPFECREALDHAHSEIRAAANADAVEFVRHRIEARVDNGVFQAILATAIDVIEMLSPDDTWSGRDNDARRVFAAQWRQAAHDEIRKAASDAGLGY